MSFEFVKQGLLKNSIFILYLRITLYLMQEIKV